MRIRCINIQAKFQKVESLQIACIASRMFPMMFLHDRVSQLKPGMIATVLRSDPKTEQAVDTVQAVREKVHKPLVHQACFI